MQAIYDAESGGTDFWMDRLLARPGNDPAGTWLMTRGRALFMKTHTPARLGFGGQVAYWESISNQQRLHGRGHARAPSPSRSSQRWQAPSHWRSVHTSGSITVNQTKFITDNNVAVTNLSITNTGTGVDHAAAAGDLAVRHLRQRQRADRPGQRVQQPHHAVPAAVRRRLHRHQRRAQPVGHRRAPAPTVTAKVVMGFVTNEIPESLTEYNTYAGYSNATAFATHVRDYNLWWAQNVPVHRRARAGHQEEHLLPLVADALQQPRRRHPRADFQFPTSIEGVLGYNNAIVLTQPMHIDDLKYLRNPIYSYGDWLSVGQVVQGRPVPGQPRRPGELVQQLHPVHRRGGLAQLPDPRRPAGDRRPTSPGTPRATSRASSPSTTTTTTGSSSTTGAR